MPFVSFLLLFSFKYKAPIRISLAKKVPFSTTNFITFVFYFFGDLNNFSNFINCSCQISNFYIESIFKWRLIIFFVTYNNWMIITDRDIFNIWFFIFNFKLKNVLWPSFFVFSLTFEYINSFLSYVKTSLPFSTSDTAFF